MSTKLRSPDLQRMLRDHIRFSQPETLATCRKSFQVLHRASRRCLPWIVSPLFWGYAIIWIRSGRIFDEMQFSAPIQLKTLATMSQQFSHLRKWTRIRQRRHAKRSGIERIVIIHAPGDHRQPSYPFWSIFLNKLWRHVARVSAGSIEQSRAVSSVSLPHIWFESHFLTWISKSFNRYDSFRKILSTKNSGDMSQEFPQTR